MRIKLLDSSLRLRLVIILFLGKLKKLFISIFSINGLLVTIALGITVGFLSNKVQDAIQRQRYLELLEYEVRSDVLQFSIVKNDFEYDGKTDLEYYLNDDVYKAGLGNGYILTLEPSEQIHLLVFYRTVSSYNSILQGLYSKKDTSQTIYLNCLLNKPLPGCNKKQFDLEQQLYSEQINKTWGSFFDLTYKDAVSFNPTKERLQSPLLKLLMGNKSLEVQK